ncbi:MAG TPA: SGNH/GDSL hydrolase family protein [Bacteroidales bacterium]|nr:SGNH/GDSL hydrolase family protein [Bacteroidales bacterium]
MKKIFLILFSLAFLTACERKIDELSPSANGVNFSNYVAVGNSLTAGYADGALYKSGQENSYPNIMATQFRFVGGGDFRQPLISTEEGVGFSLTLTGIYCYTKHVLKVVPDRDCAGNPVGTYSLKPDFIDPNADQATLQAQLFAPPVTAGPYNNMGVAGAQVQSLFIPGYGSQFGNPFFTRFATSPSTTIIQDAMAQQPTFFSLWIGNNDVLFSALLGTDVLVTPVDTFAKYYTMAVAALMNSGKSPKGVLMTIPDVSTTPYFNTITTQLPYNGLLLDTAQAAGLNILYSMYGHPDITFHPGYNPWVITTTTGEWKQMGPQDLFLLNLPTDSVKCRGMGVANPMTLTPYPFPAQYVLEKSEQDNLNTAVQGYNAVIKQLADANGLALADMNAYMKQLIPGLVFDGIKMNTTFVTGGTFSTDGLHLNPRGNAVVANYIIDAINAKYGCSVPHADVTSYHGLIFP